MFGLRRIRDGTHRKTRSRRGSTSAALAPCSIAERNLPIVVSRFSFLVPRARARTFQLTPPSSSVPYMMSVRLCPAIFRSRSFSLTADRGNLDRLVDGKSRDRRRHCRGPSPRGKVRVTVLTRWKPRNFMVFVPVERNCSSEQSTDKQD